MKKAVNLATVATEFLSRPGLAPTTRETYELTLAPILNEYGSWSIEIISGTIKFGLLLLMATPISRVVFSLFAFIRERDLTYIIMTLIVLTALIYSLVGGNS
ncbi:DUF1634 domain-containing protein [Nostoc sp.]|uniref:DUF1634 domain-containing protein n=1 Tax=Nostoc sp. TaxID=1180 RepID=UPI002FFC7DCF